MQRGAETPLTPFVQPNEVWNPLPTRDGSRLQINGEGTSSTGKTCIDASEISIENIFGTPPIAARLAQCALSQFEHCVVDCAEVGTPCNMSR